MSNEEVINATSQRTWSKEEATRWVVFFFQTRPPDKSEDRHAGFLRILNCIVKPYVREAKGSWIVCEQDSGPTNPMIIAVGVDSEPVVFSELTKCHELLSPPNILEDLIAEDSDKFFARLPPHITDKGWGGLVNIWLTGIRLFVPVENKQIRSFSISNGKITIAHIITDQEEDHDQ